MPSTATPRAFVWPPRRPGEIDLTGNPRTDQPRPSPTSPTSLTSLTSPNSTWRQTEAAWLDQTAAPLADRIGTSVPRYARCGHQHRQPDDAPITERTDGDLEACNACGKRAIPWTRLVCLGSFAGQLREVIHEIKFAQWRAAGWQAGTLLGRSLEAQLRSSGLGGLPVAVVPAPMSWRRRMWRGIDHTRVMAAATAAAINADRVAATKASAGGTTRRVPKSSEARVCPLLAKRHRRPQAELAASQRRSNIDGAIFFRGSHTSTPAASWSQMTFSLFGGLLSRCGRLAAALPQPARALLGLLPGIEAAAAVDWAQRQSGEVKAAGKGAEGGGGRLVVIVVDDVTTSGATLEACCRAVTKGLAVAGIGRHRVTLWAAVMGVTERSERSGGTDLADGGDQA